ncbi:MAG: DUF3047 domain-containing protein [Desulfuromonadales bacterium]
MRLFTVFFLLCAVTAAAEPMRIIDDFENGLDPRWETKSFKGFTDYQVVVDGAERALRAESRESASALIYKIDYDLREHPLLSWRWKVGNVLAKGDARSKAGDDYAARLYVIFPHWYPPKTRSINYIWANRMPVGDFLPNAFYGKAVLLAVESGAEKAGQWVEEVRDVRADFRRIFGEEPPRVGAIAIMTDTDNTGGAATAWYDDIRICADGKRQGRAGGEKEELCP